MSKSTTSFRRLMAEQESTFAPIFSNEPVPKPSDRCDVRSIDLSSWVSPVINAIIANDGTTSFQAYGENGAIGDTRLGDVIAVHRTPHGDHMVSITHPEVTP